MMVEEVPSVKSIAQGKMRSNTKLVVSFLFKAEEFLTGLQLNRIVECRSVRITRRFTRPSSDDDSTGGR